MSDDPRTIEEMVDGGIVPQEFPAGGDDEAWARLAGGHHPVIDRYAGCEASSKDPKPDKETLAAIRSHRLASGLPAESPAWWGARDEDAGGE